MVNKIPRAQLNALKEALKNATFENSNFFVFDKDEKALNAELRERTRLYRETWIIPRIQAVIDWAEGR